MLESGLQSNLTSAFSYKNEVKSIISVQQGANYGFVVEIQSPLGTYYCPLVGYKSKDTALREVRKMLK